MPWSLIITEAAEKDLARLGDKDREAVGRVLGRLLTDPASTNFKKLGGRGDEWRLRVGSWRVLLRLDNTAGVMRVLRVLPRSIAYRD